MSCADTLGVTVLGSTGSIGVSTLDVLSRHPQDFHVHALTARRDVDGLVQQCLAHRPRYAVMTEAAAALELGARLHAAGCATQVLQGAAALEQVAADAGTHTVMAAIVGAAGLLPTLAAARAGKRILLANKEALVMSGALFMQAVRDSGAELLPVDSEHNALFQCMPAGYRAGEKPRGVRRVLLTASGGPFRATDPATLDGVTPAQAVAHPNWDMGRKISVDSATMMNKGLEVIEAHWLFALPPEAIEVVVHPQSVIHSLVDYADGSMLAQLGNPDMRTPIAHALGYPRRLASGVAPLDLCRLGRLDFAPPDERRFPCLRLAYHALAAGGAASTILNAANEVAVEAFLEQGMQYTAIAAVIETVLTALPAPAAESLEVVLAVDAEARRLALQAVAAAPRR
jgi:1-deoxy-D-xylulose-5-phosphate reductoisomerase